MHRNGYVREAAVRVLASMSSAEELPWLLLRCTDWVPEVGALAVEAVRARCIGPAPDPAYLHKLADAVALLESERFDSATTLRNDLRAVLFAQPAALRRAAESVDRATRRAAVRLLAEVDPSIDLLRMQLAGGDVVAATTAAEALLHSPSECEAAARLLLEARPARLRQSGLWHILNHGDHSDPVVETYLVDTAFGVRDIAQRHARNAGWDVAGWYRGRLANAPLGALLGLGEVGGEQDVAAAEPYVRAESPKVRAAAVRMIARVGSRGEIPRLLHVIAFESRRVAREALVGIRRHGVPDDVALAAWDTATGASTPDAGRRRIFVRVLRKASRWTAAELALRCLTLRDEQLRMLGGELLAYTVATWNSSQTAPSSSRLDDLRGVIAAVASSPLPQNADGHCWSSATS